MDTPHLYLILLSYEQDHCALIYYLCIQCMSSYLFDIFRSRQSHSRILREPFVGMEEGRRFSQSLSSWHIVRLCSLSSVELDKGGDFSFCKCIKWFKMKEWRKHTNVVGVVLSCVVKVLMDHKFAHREFLLFWVSFIDGVLSQGDRVFPYFCSLAVQIKCTLVS